ncbi:hypothetical protein J2W83_001530 [Pseudomonas hunanensis]|uniref:Uncharacterized protein n=1 Tax=Pseudomonas hunanensis TaxID=1247546 RepID=A0ACC6K0H6_9PSED|nr:hypothetical protein [Pseudomonas hunanensis]MDR6711935.1 hypothetical protein [Pseudomonas hunanensis]
MNKARKYTAPPVGAGLPREEAIRFTLNRDSSLFPDVAMLYVYSYTLVHMINRLVSERQDQQF